MTARKQFRLSRRTTELAGAVPQVVAMRVGRMMAAGLSPNARDQQEMYRMGAEKVTAFQQSWLAMSTQTLAAQQQFALWWMQTWWRVALGGWMNPPSLSQLSSTAHKRMVNSLLDVTMHGMAPVHRTAVANARRLSRPSTPRPRPQK